MLCAVPGVIHLRLSINRSPMVCQGELVIPSLFWNFLLDKSPEAITPTAMASRPSSGHRSLASTALHVRGEG